MIQTINFPLSPYCIRPFEGWVSLEQKVRGIGLDGIEAIADPEELDDTVPQSIIAGWHMVFYPDWLDFYRHDESALLSKFHSWEAVEKIYRGRTPNVLMQQFKDDLKLAMNWKTPYLVFHVSDVSLEESYTYRWLHGNKEVLDGAIEFINEMLNGVEPTFDFLVENQWWPGFTFTDPAETEYLLSHINYPRVGIMLDTGHLMNTNQAIRTEADGIKYIHEMLDKHGELSKLIYGMHFHQSLSGAYCRRVIGKLPVDYPKEYFQAFFVTYPHIEQIDRHRPWTDKNCVTLLDRIEPKYLTHELKSNGQRTQFQAVVRQIRLINRGREYLKHSRISNG